MKNLFWVISQKYTIDKSKWGPGAWQDEPDKIHFVDPDTDLDCLIVRTKHTGALCGYVACVPGHVWHGKEYDDCDVAVHGGLTFAAACTEGGKICHVPREGHPADVWWLGFDCSHNNDLIPVMFGELGLTGFPGIYRDLAYVKSEIESLCRQVKAAS